MAQAREKKAQTVKDIAGRFSGTEAALLTEYRGLRVGEIAEVRNALREADADYKVLKNTLTRLAVREVGLDELVEMLEGPVAVAFCRGDAAAAAKALDDAAKRFPVLSIKGGVLKGKVIDADAARRLARLESRDVLLTKVALLMNAPAQQTVNVLAALLRDLGSMLAQVVAAKEAEATPVAEAAQATTPTAEPAEAEEAEVAEEAVIPETEERDAAEAGAEEAEPPAETAEAVDQAPAAPEPEAYETQPPSAETSDESAPKEEE